MSGEIAGSDVWLTALEAAGETYRARSGRRGGTSAMRLMLRFLGLLFAAGTILFVVGVAAAAGLLWHYSQSLPGLFPVAGLRARGDDAGARFRRLAARRICARAPALYSDPGGAQARHQRLHRGGRQELLRARRHRLLRHRARRGALRAAIRQRAAGRRAPPPSPSRSPRTSCSPTSCRSRARSRKRCWR